MYPTYVTRANRRDCDAIFNLVNEAYKVEIGESGVAYKNCDKYRLKDQARKQLPDMLVLRDHRRILGCTRAILHNGVVEISILAVHPEAQGNGYGDKLMTAAESMGGRVEKCTVGVPSCRTDVIPFFVKRGYKEVVSKSVEEMRKLYPEELNEKTLTRDDIEWIMLVKKIEQEEEKESDIPELYPTA